MQSTLTRQCESGSVVLAKALDKGQTKYRQPFQVVQFDFHPNCQAAFCFVFEKKKIWIQRNHILIRISYRMILENADKKEGKWDEASS